METVRRQADRKGQGRRSEQGAGNDCADLEGGKTDSLQIGHQQDTYRAVGQRPQRAGHHQPAGVIGGAFGQPARSRADAAGTGCGRWPGYRVVCLVAAHG